MLKGVSKLLVAYQMEIRDEVFIDKLGNVSVKEIIRSARERNGGVLGYAEALLGVYNRKMHNPISSHKLYNHNPSKTALCSEEIQPGEFAAQENNQLVEHQVQIQTNIY